MRYYAVVDTNVIVAALLSKHEDAATLRVMNAVFDGTITPLYHGDMIAEYREVLLRPKFHLAEDDVRIVVDAFVRLGIEVSPRPSGEILIDTDDLVFYEVALEKRDVGAYLVTGNLKHYPAKRFVVTPAEMMQIIEQGG